MHNYPTYAGNITFLASTDNIYKIIEEKAIDLFEKKVITLFLRFWNLNASLISAYALFGVVDFSTKTIFISLF